MPWLLEILFSFPITSQPFFHEPTRYFHMGIFNISVYPSIQIWKTPISSHQPILNLPCYILIRILLQQHNPAIPTLHYFLHAHAHIFLVNDQFYLNGYDLIHLYISIVHLCSH